MAHPLLNGFGGFNKSNWRQGRNPHNNFSGGGIINGNKRKSPSNVYDENKQGQNGSERNKKQLDDDKIASYVGLPSAVLYCHVCSKHMCDYKSFTKHVFGKPHKLMMTSLEEEYRLHVNLMRHQMKSAEKRKEFDIKNIKNFYKSNSTDNNKTSGGTLNLSKHYYCKMCETYYVYDLLYPHRKCDGHMKLKQFLHPECKLCNCSFRKPLVMDEHKLSAEHLKKMVENRNVKYPYLKDDEFDLIDMICIEEAKQNQDQLPIAKKNDMLMERDATNLDLELEGGIEKRDSSGTRSNVEFNVIPKEKNISVIKEENIAVIKEENLAVIKEDNTDVINEENTAVIKEENTDDIKEEIFETLEITEMTNNILVNESIKEEIIDPTEWITNEFQYEFDCNSYIEERQYDLIDMIKVEEDTKDDIIPCDIKEEYTIENEEEIIQSSSIIATEKSTVENTAVNESTEEINVPISETVTNKNHQTAVYNGNIAKGKEWLVPSKGFVCRLCHCFLSDEKYILIHCSSNLHCAKFLTMTKIKKANSRGQKRGIDQVLEQVKDTVDIENVSKDVKLKSEVTAFKRIKVEH